MRMSPSLLTIAVALVCGTGQLRADSCNGSGDNLVANCGFESGSFAAWTGSTTTSFMSGVDQVSPYSGSYGAYLGSVESTTTLTQVLSTTAGTSYLIEFALMNDTTPSAGETNSLSVSFDGNILFSESAASADDYQLYYFSAQLGQRAHLCPSLQETTAAILIWTPSA